MNYIGQLRRKRNTRNADLVAGALTFRSDGDATGQRPKTRGRFLQWSSQGLPGWATCLPGGSKWGRKWEKFEEKSKNLIQTEGKNEESGTLAHPGLWGLLRPWFLWGIFSQKRELFSEETKIWGKRWVIEKFWPTFYANISFGKLWTQSNKKKMKQKITFDKMLWK